LHRLFPARRNPDGMIPLSNPHMYQSQAFAKILARVSAQGFAGPERIAWDPSLSVFSRDDHAIKESGPYETFTVVRNQSHMA
jgi:hypothetical protein